MRQALTKDGLGPAETLKRDATTCLQTGQGRLACSTQSIYFFDIENRLRMAEKPVGSEYWKQSTVLIDDDEVAGSGKQQLAVGQGKESVLVAYTDQEGETQLIERRGKKWVKRGKHTNTIPVSQC